MAGIVNPRMLIKAQQKIAQRIYGCELVDGQVDKVARSDSKCKGIDQRQSLFMVDITTYPMNEIGGNISAEKPMQVLSKKVILAGGVYTNILPVLEVSATNDKRLHFYTGVVSMSPKYNFVSVQYRLFFVQFFTFNCHKSSIMV